MYLINAIKLFEISVVDYPKEQLTIEDIHNIIHNFTIPEKKKKNNKQWKRDKFYYCKPVIKDNNLFDNAIHQAMFNMLDEKTKNDKEMYEYVQKLKLKYKLDKILDQNKKEEETIRKTKI